MRETSIHVCVRWPWSMRTCVDVQRDRIAMVVVEVVVVEQGSGKGGRRQRVGGGGLGGGGKKRGRSTFGLAEGVGGWRGRRTRDIARG